MVCLLGWGRRSRYSCAGDIKAPHTSPSGPCNHQIGSSSSACARPSAEIPPSTAVPPHPRMLRRATTRRRSPGAQPGSLSPPQLRSTSIWDPGSFAGTARITVTSCPSSSPVVVLVGLSLYIYFYLVLWVK